MSNLTHTVHIEPPLQRWSLIQNIQNPVARTLLVLALSNVLLIASAKVTIPLGPIPLSMQTLAVVMIGAVCGTKLGLAAIFLYLFEGALGAPVFAGTPAKGIGLAYMVGPTGGYLLGFILASMWCGYTYQKGWMQKIHLLLMHICIAFSLIYIPGLLWLGQIIGWDKPILEFGFYPFLLGDALKLILAVVLIRMMHR